MTYKNKEGYPDPTSGRAINGVRWEELQQLREKEHNLKRGQQVILYVKSQSEGFLGGAVGRERSGVCSS